MERILFVDDRYIESQSNTERTLGQFIKDDAPVIRPELPWEFNCTNAWGSVIYDPNDSSFRLWYEAYSKYPSKTILCYASSRDLLNWEKPELNLQLYNGSGKNNIILPPDLNFDSPSVIFDAQEQQYKMSLFFDRKSGKGIYTGCSNDGFNWEISKLPISPTGDRHCLMKDTLKNRYLITTKPHPEVPRRISVIESDDFVNWAPAKEVLQADANDNLQTELYGLTPFIYEGIYLGFLEVFNVPERRLHTELVVSSDGYDWKRVCRGDKLLECGKPGAFDYTWAFPSFNSPILYGEELVILYNGRRTLHWASPPMGHVGAIGKAGLRRDGFVSLKTTGSGEIILKPFVFAEDLLYINADASRGKVLVELMDENGKAYQGYSLQDCQPLNKDLTYHEMTWDTSFSVSELKGKLVRMRIKLQDASLYSIGMSSHREVIEKD